MKPKITKLEKKTLVGKLKEDPQGFKATKYLDTLQVSKKLTQYEVDELFREAERLAFPWETK